MASATSPAGRGAWTRRASWPTRPWRYSSVAAFRSSSGRRFLSPPLGPWAWPGGAAPGGAHAWYERALEPALASGDRPVIARVVELLADIALAGGDAEQAATLLGTAEVLRGM